MMKLEKSLVYFSTSLKGNEMVLEKMLRMDMLRKYPDDSDLLEDVIIENKQAMEMCAIYRDIMSGTMDAFASIISNNLNVVMKVLTSLTVVLSIPTLFASLWGMNVGVPFENAPFGFWMVLGISVVASVAAFVLLWRKKMFGGGFFVRTALITGGSRGIGAAAVRAFARAGFRAAFFYRADEAAAQTVARETGAAAIRCDVSDPDRVRKACAEAEKTLGHIDALVNNAGIAQQKLLTDITDEDWRRMLDVNLSGAFYVTRAVLPGMISLNSGSIVNVSSVWGQVGASCEVH